MLDWSRDAARAARTRSVELSEYAASSQARAQAAAHRLPGATEVVEWLRQRYADARGRLGRTEPTELERLETGLVGVVAAIRQVPDRQAKRLVSLVIGKVGGAGALGGIGGLISTFGTASTGTAIASLSGAAATTAKLYWIGSLIGLGVTGGTVLLAGTGIGATLVAAHGVSKLVFGKPRAPEDIQDYERAILAACATLLGAVREELAAGRDASRDQMRIIAEQALVPLLNEIEMHRSPQSLALAGVSHARSFTETLSPMSLRKLDRSRQNLGDMALQALA